MKQIIIVAVLVLLYMQSINAQNELEKINKTLLNYIEGTANGEPERVREAFDEGLNLYHIKKDSLVIWKGKNYVSNIKQGKKSNRIGRIISVDYENNAAMAKVEILMPKWKRIYTDYMMLLKIKGEWKIIHKSFTYHKYPE
ncbi:nuclear transport factor 2 family protein [uncultured Tenacibaculum sp.]|uniref:nuclear transport factor 2 family protein n=1 Tax=uncultured Tenacibaculum sp. TaxID=174713 RepID=UPI002618762B|nr:nuclear transport factor 2 family protein [uncultured Tenacibaculum sp.]